MLPLGSGRGQGGRGGDKWEKETEVREGEGRELTDLSSYVSYCCGWNLVFI